MLKDTTMNKDGKTLFAKQQSEGNVSEVEGDITRFQPGSGITPSGEKIFKGVSVGEVQKFDVTTSHSPTEVKGNTFRPQGEKIMKGTKLEGEEAV